jgi:hypothetical protein
MPSSGSHPPQRPKITYDAPIASIDFDAFDPDGSAREIWACTDCLPWRAEVVLDDGDIRVREWHAWECPWYQELLAIASDQ